MILFINIRPGSCAEVANIFQDSFTVTLDIFNSGVWSKVVRYNTLLLSQTVEYPSMRGRVSDPDLDPVSAKILENCRKVSESDLSEENLKFMTKDRQKMKKATISY